MIVHSDKLQAILLDKRKSDHTDQRIVVDNKNISGIICRITRYSIDDKLNFNLHISNIVGLVQII